MAERMTRAGLSDDMVAHMLAWHDRWGSGPYKQGPYFHVEIAEDQPPQAHLEVLGWAHFGVVHPPRTVEWPTIPALLERLAPVVTLLRGTSPSDLVVQVGVVGLVAYGTEVATELVAQVGRAAGLLHPSAGRGDPGLQEGLRRLLSCAVGAVALVAATRLTVWVWGSEPVGVSAQSAQEDVLPGQGPVQEVTESRPARREAGFGARPRREASRGEDATALGAGGAGVAVARPQGRPFSSPSFQWELGAGRQIMDDRRDDRLEAKRRQAVGRPGPALPQCSAFDEDYLREVRRRRGRDGEQPGAEAREAESSDSPAAYRGERAFGSDEFEREIRDSNRDLGPCGGSSLEREPAAEGAACARQVREEGRLRAAAEPARAVPGEYQGRSCATSAGQPEKETDGAAMDGRARPGRDGVSTGSSASVQHPGFRAGAVSGGDRDGPHPSRACRGRAGPPAGGRMPERGGGHGPGDFTSPRSRSAGSSRRPSRRRPESTTSGSGKRASSGRRTPAISWSRGSLQCRRLRKVRSESAGLRSGRRR